MLSLFLVTLRYGLTLVLKYFSLILLERGQWRHREVITNFITTFIGAKRHTTKNYCSSLWTLKCTVQRTFVFLSLLFVCFLLLLLLVLFFQRFNHFLAVQQWNKLLWRIPGLFCVGLHGAEPRSTSRQSIAKSGEEDFRGFVAKPAANLINSCQFEFIILHTLATLILTPQKRINWYLH